MTRRSSPAKAFLLLLPSQTARYSSQFNWMKNSLSAAGSFPSANSRRKLRKSLLDSGSFVLNISSKICVLLFIGHDTTEIDQHCSTIQYRRKSWSPAEGFPS